MTVNRLRSDERLFSLQSWQIMTRIYVQHHKSGALTIPDSTPMSAQMRWELFHLTDYVVSSVTAGTIWLVER